MRRGSSAGRRVPYSARRARGMLQGHGEATPASGSGRKSRLLRNVALETVAQTAAPASGTVAGFLRGPHGAGPLSPSE